MLHQVPSTSAMYEILMQKLAADYWCIAPDFPGFGGSDPLSGATTIAAYGAAMFEALQALDVAQCYLFGHHTGASVAVQLASDHPGFARRIALSGPTLLSEELKQLLPTKSYAFPETADGDHFLQMWQRVRGKDPDAPLWLSQREALTGISLGDTYPQAYQAVIDQDYASQLQTLECPVFVFAGTEDPLYGQLDAALALLKDGRKAEIPGGRTYVCERNADLIAGWLQEFFRD